MTEEILTGEATGEAAAAAEVSEAAAAPPGKCTRSPVLTVGLRLRFHSNRPKEDQFIAGIAFLTTGSSKIKLFK